MKDYCKTLRIFRIHEVKINKMILKNSRMVFRSTT
nr:MAG TPA: Interleukin-12 alpha subunit [Caudoviricetes sp.]